MGLEPNEAVGITLKDFFQTEEKNFLPIASHLKALEGTSSNYEFGWKGYIFDTRVDPLRDDQGNIIFKEIVFFTCAFIID